MSAYRILKSPMLQRDKLTHEIVSLADKLFTQQQQYLNCTPAVWQALVGTDMFAQRIKALPPTLPVTQWLEPLENVYTVPTASPFFYTTLAVDGSQVYPDRHHALIECFLINVGGCTLSYGEQSSASFFSAPSVLVPSKALPSDLENLFSADVVDLVREDYELAVGFERALKLRDAHDPFVYFIDGTLIFNHLESKPELLKDYFLGKYIQHFNNFYRNGILHAGYISLPRNRDLVQLLKAAYCPTPCTPDCANSPINCTLLAQQLENTVDAHMMHHILAPGQRSAIFKSRVPMATNTLIALSPCFFYLNVGKEIVRIEVPFWIAQNTAHVDVICHVAYDQAQKGNGYPVALAEAHEQAIIRGADRDFFFHVVYKTGMENNKQIIISQKQLKKKSIGF